MAAELSIDQDAAYGPYAYLRPVSPVVTRNIGIIWATGWKQTTGGTITEVFAGQPGGQQKLIWSLAERYTVLVTQRGLNSNPANLWGNAAGVAAIEDAYQALQVLGCDTRVGLAGVSGGVPDITQWGEANASNVRGVASIMGATDLQWLRDTWVVVFGLDARADIDAAWGVTYPAPLPAGAEPYTAASAFSSSVPAAAWIGSLDNTVSVNGSQLWTTNAGGSLYTISGAGHDDVLINAVDRDILSNLFVN